MTQKQKTDALLPASTRKAKGSPAYDAHGKPTWIPGFNGSSVSSFVSAQRPHAASGGGRFHPPQQETSIKPFQNDNGKMVAHTTSILPNGKTSDAYIIDGVTYQDPNGKRRIDFMTRVNTANGQYVYTPNGSFAVGTSKPYSKAITSYKPSAPASTRPIQTSYINANGERKTGYLIGGTTYQDPDGKQRIPNGSVVSTNGGTYWMKPDGKGVRIYEGDGNSDSFQYGGKLYQLYRNPLGHPFVDPEYTTPVPENVPLTMGGVTYSRDPALGVIPTAQGVLSHYDLGRDRAIYAAQQIRIAQENKIAEDIHRQLQRIAQRRHQLEQEYRLANQASYHAYRDAVNPYGRNAEQLAALGLSESGVAESNLISLANAYQQALAGNERERIRALTELELAAQEAITQGNAASYDAISKMYENISRLEMQAADNRAALGMQSLTQSHQNQRFQQELDFKQQEFLQEDARQAQKLALQLQKMQTDEKRILFSQALQLLKTGASNAHIAQALGISENQARTIAAVLLNAAM